MTPMRIRKGELVGLPAGVLLYSGTQGGESMTDYISRAEAIELMSGSNIEDRLDSEPTSEPRRYARAAQRVIWSVPAADVAPAVHAEWVLMVTRDDINSPERYSWNCNGCGYRRKSGESITVRMRKPKGMYCEHCGAVMDGGAKDAVDQR